MRLEVAAGVLLAAIVWITLTLVGLVRAAEPVPLPKTGQCPSRLRVRSRLLRSDAPGCADRGAEDRPMPERVRAIGRLLQRDAQAPLGRESQVAKTPFTRRLP